eukprot:c6023_g1_i2.p1 GENE.c6023_g1_i2~~c6023_g1_i2.p1  ORF type:complete len:400 (-),score=151.46 c6023_g1_i2:20-1219(-)
MGYKDLSDSSPYKVILEIKGAIFFEEPNKQFGFKILIQGGSKTFYCDVISERIKWRDSMSQFFPVMYPEPPKFGSVTFNQPKLGIQCLVRNGSPYISKIMKGSQADLLGIKAGDEITHINGQLPKASHTIDFAAYLVSLQRPLVLTMKSQNTVMFRFPKMPIGLNLRITENFVIVSGTETKSFAELVGILTDDVIVSLNGKNFEIPKSVEETNQLISFLEPPYSITVKRLWAKELSFQAGDINYFEKNAIEKLRSQISPENDSAKVTELNIPTEPKSQTPRSSQPQLLIAPQVQVHSPELSSVSNKSEMNYQFTLKSPKLVSPKKISKTFQEFSGFRNSLIQEFSEILDVPFPGNSISNELKLSSQIIAVRAEILSEFLLFILENEKYVSSKIVEEYLN